MYGTPSDPSEAAAGKGERWAGVVMKELCQVPGGSVQLAC